MEYKAFVSSTFLDLQDHRAHVIAELEQAGFQVSAMEKFPAAASEPKEFSKERLIGCHLCVLLVARRRGHRPTGEERSITQMEYDEARRRGIDVLLYFLDDAVTAWPAQWDERARDPHFAPWLAELCERHTGRTFNERPESLRIGAHLVQWVQDRGRQVALDIYLKLVQQEHGTIRFLALPQMKDTADAPIGQLYVEPSIARRFISPDLDPKEWPTTQPVLAAVHDHSRLVLLGDPGSGKSTLVSWIAWQLARHHREGTSPATERLGRLVPVPIILRDLDIQPGLTWDGLLAAFAKTPLGMVLTPTLLRQFLEAGQALVMLDGLDEIGNRLLRRELRDAVWYGILKHYECRWLLTSRIVGYDEMPYQEQRGGNVELGDGEKIHFRGTRTHAELCFVAPFDDAQVERFATNWLELREQSSVRVEAGAKDLIAAVRSDPGTLRLGRIPNLLTMMALIHRKEAELPHGRAKLYAKIAEAYLESIDKWYRIPRRTEDWQERKRWLARVGFEMQRRRSAERGLEEEVEKKAKEILATAVDVRAWVAAAMADSGQSATDTDAAEFVDYLAKRSGLLLPRGQDQFAFLHLSFQEYFAACFLQDQIVSPDWRDGGTEGVAAGATAKDVQRCANETVWRETLVFLVEVLAAEQRKFLKPARDCLFGHDLSAVAAGENVDKDRAVLLARLAIDPYTGFDPATREQALRSCCRWEAMNAVREVNIVARTLLSVDKAERQRILALLVAEARAVGSKAIDLSGTPVSDLSPLVGLSRLTTLSLRDTQVSDLSPLAGLSRLTTLDLRGTPVSDLSPLAGLSGLTALYLYRTQVSDLSPLAGLKKLAYILLSKDRKVRIPDSLKQAVVH